MVDGGSRYGESKEIGRGSKIYGGSKRWVVKSGWVVGEIDGWRK